MSTLPEGQPAADRVVISNVQPAVECGAYPAKRTVGESLRVSADIFTDGHDKLAASLLWRFAGDEDWFEEELRPSVNDRWEGEFPLDRCGEHEFTLMAWVDRFASWRSDTLKKWEAGDRELAADIQEGLRLIEAAHLRAHGRDKTALKQGLAQARAAKDLEAQVDALAAEEIAECMRRYPPPEALNQGYVYRVYADRPLARFGAWYEFFPRSAGSDPKKSATLKEAESALPDIAAMGFTIVYLPPVHPIGRSHRKGPNNTLGAKAGDPGSPWAIGSAEGGHKSIHPELGTLKDFDRFVAAARKLNLEVALDLAFQCSPDHPYVKEHPEWFRHRPDGTIKYAENPPKKYQDIYPFDFECEAWQSLWLELLDVVRFWVGHGVKIFRVDNPHTKPFAFWRWLIASVQREHPEVFFLSEAFTRPKVMKHLAKCGFGQSYTYFTWRNTKREIETYLAELTRTESAEYMRPNFFANTPDILHEYLQVGGRSAFQIRAVLAATLAASYGIYGPPFELCVGDAMPGSEEYRNSEKYQICAWDRNGTGNIKGLITTLNEIRNERRALQYDSDLEFHDIDNEDLIAYSKRSPDGRDMVLVVVCLDPRRRQSGWLHVPAERFGASEGEVFQVHDLLSGERYLWRGGRNFIQLNPAVLPAHVFHVKRRVKTETDFDYFL